MLRGTIRGLCRLAVGPQLFDGDHAPSRQWFIDAVTRLLDPRVEYLFEAHNWINNEQQLESLTATAAILDALDACPGSFEVFSTLLTDAGHVTTFAAIRGFADAAVAVSSPAPVPA